MSGMDTTDGPGGRYSSKGGGRGRGGFQGSGYSNNFRGRGRGRGRSSTRGGGRTSFGSHSSSTYKRGSQQNLPPDVEALGTRGGKDGGHKTTITCLAWDYSSNKLYSGSKDGHVCVWSLETQKVQGKVYQDAESVDSLLIEGGYLFVGVHSGQAGVIKVYNMSTGEQMTLPGHKGEIYGMHVANNMLFSVGRDCGLYCWGFDAATNQFVGQARLGAEQGGHEQPIMSIISIGAFLYTADMGGSIKVWDLSSGTCTQTITAHEHAITALMPWSDSEGSASDYLLSSSFDGSVRVWQLQEVPQPGAVLVPVPLFTHPDNSAQGGSSNAKRLSQILAMAGQLDANGMPVLVTTHTDDGCARLWSLPTFDDRGILPKAPDARAVCSGPDGTIFTGDETGLVRIFKFKPGQNPR